MANSKMEIRTNAKDIIASQFVNEHPEAVQIGDYTYAIPMGIAPDATNHPLCVKVEISCPNWYKTAKTEAFNLDEKVAAYNAELAERAAKAEEKAKVAAEKEAKRQESESAE